MCAVFASLLPVLPSRAAEGIWRDGKVQISGPAFPSLVVGTDREMIYAVQSDMGTAVQDLGFEGAADPSFFGHYGDSLSYPTAPLPPPAENPSAVGDLSGDGEVDLLFEHRTDRVLEFRGSQRDAFLEQGAGQLRQDDIRGLVILEKTGRNSTGIAVAAGTQGFTAYGWDERLTEVPLKYTLPAGLTMNDVLAVEHRQDWETDFGEVELRFGPRLGPGGAFGLALRNSRFLVLVRDPKTGALSALPATFSSTEAGGELSFGDRLDLKVPAGRGAPASVALAYDWVPYTTREGPSQDLLGLVVGARFLYPRAGSAGYEGFLALTIALAGDPISAGPFPFCSSASDQPAASDLDVESVSVKGNQAHLFAACSSVDGDSLRTEVFTPDFQTLKTTAPIGDLTSFARPQSQLVFPCLWMLENRPSGSRCSSNPDGDLNQPGNFSVATVVNAGTRPGELRPLYVSRSFTPRGLLAQWHRRITDVVSGYTVALPLPHRHPQITVELNDPNGAGRLVPGDPVPIAFLAAPPHVKGAGQEAGPPVFATTKSSSESAGEALSTHLGGYFGIDLEVPVKGIVGGVSLRVDISNEVEDSRSTFRDIAQSETYEGLVDQDVMVFQNRVYRRFDGVVTESSTGVGLGRTSTFSMPDSLVTSAASMDYVRTQFDEYFGATGPLRPLDEQVLTHHPGNPGSYLPATPAGRPDMAAVDNYCDGSYSQNPAEQRDWRANLNVPAKPDFPVEVPTISAQPDVFRSDQHLVLVGTGNAEGASIGITSGDERSRVSTLSEDVEAGASFVVSGGVTFGFSQSRETSTSFAKGNEFSGSVGHIPHTNPFLQNESYKWRMFLCQKTVPTGIGDVTVWVLNYTVDNYQGSGGLEPMVTPELESPRRSEITLPKQPELRWKRNTGTVQRYDWELEAVGDPHHLESDRTKEPAEGLGYATPAQSNAESRTSITVVTPEPLREHQLYRWRVIATDFFGQEVVSPYEYFQTDGKPVANFEFKPTTAAAGEEVTFTSTSRVSKVRPMTYEWDFGDETGFEETVPPGGDPSPVKHAFDSSGVWNVTLKTSTERGETHETKGVVVAASAVDDDYRIPEDGRLAVAAPGVLANDGTGGAGAAEGDAIYASLAVPPLHGTARLRPDGDVTYVPEANFCGRDRFSYYAHTGDLRRVGDVMIDVDCVDDLPEGASDSFSGVEDNPLVVGAAGLLANDRDVDGQALSAVLTRPPARGRVTVGTDGSFTYVPVADFCGEDRFTYQTQSGEGGEVASSPPVSAVVLVGCVNDLPVANDDNDVVTDEDSRVTIPVLANDRDPDGDSLTVAVGRAPAHGAVSVTPDGRIAYVPAVNFHGTDVFSYSLDDGRGGTQSGSVAVTVRPVNDAPAAVDDGFVVREDSPLALAVLANDADVDGDALSVAITEPPSVGTASVNADGSVTYSPAPNRSGGTRFVYEVDDGHGAKDSAAVNVTVIPLNDRPLAADDVLVADEGEEALVAVLANDTDADGDRLVVKVASAPQHGTAVVNADFTVAYRPGPGFGGPDSFTYTVDDGHGGIDTATVGIQVTAINDAPVAVPDHARTEEDTPARIEVLANDHDADGDTLTAAIASPPVYGTATVQPDGTVTYLPDLDRHGVDVFSYSVSDGHGGTSRASVTVGVGEANDPPVLGDDAETTEEDTPAVVRVLDNDRDPDGDRLIVAVASPPAHGSAKVAGDGTIRYMPERDYAGSDTFRYTAGDGRGEARTATVTIEVAGVNDPPVAQGEGAGTDEDTPVDLDVAANDHDPDGDALSVTVTVPPSHGRATVAGSGRVTYIPAANYSGTDSFTYTLADGHGGSSHAVLVVTVAPVNDPPVAGADTPRTAEDQPLVIPVLINDGDADGDALRVTLGVAPVHGSVVLNEDRTVTYTPAPDYVGTDQFSYAVTDDQGGSASATVTVTLTPVNDPPVAGGDEVATDEDVAVTVPVLANDSDVDGDTLKVVVGSLPSQGTATVSAEGNLVYTPHPNAHGTDSFTYIAVDGHGGRATASVNVTIHSVNDVPVAVDDERTTDEDTPFAVNVLINDFDVDGDPLTVTLARPPGQGRVEITPERTALYTPEPDYHGPDSFVYQLDDGHGGIATAMVSVTVASVNDLPQGLPDHYARQAGERELFVSAPGVLGNDSDIEGDPIEARLYSGATDGNVAMRPDGSFVYTPRPTHRGGDDFYYRVFDGMGYSDPIRVTITVVDCLDDRPELLDITRYPGYLLCVVERVVDDIVQLD